MAGSVLRHKIVQTLVVTSGADENRKGGGGGGVGPDACKAYPLGHIVLCVVLL